MKGIVQYAAFWIWLILLSKMHLRATHVVLGTNNVVFLMLSVFCSYTAESLSILEFMHMGFQILAIMNKASMDIHTWVWE